MKRTLFSLLIGLFLVSYHSKAQLALGVKAGLNFNQTSIEVAQSGGSFNDVSDSRTGFHFGAYSVIKLGPIGIQPEIFYSAQGAEITVDAVSETIKTDYLQIPVLVRLDLLKVLNIHAGPQFGFRMSESLGSADDVIKEATSNDISIAAGLGVDLPFGLNVTARYVKGLQDSFEFELDPTSPIDLKSGTNDMIMVSVGYTLIGKD